MELRIPPLALVLLAAALMWLAAWWLPAFRLPFYGHQVLALAALLAGILVAAAGLVQFRKAGTTVNPLTPEASSALVVAGVYRWTRNPMYLGFLAALTGWALYLASLATVPVLLLFVLYMNRFQIVPEERALAARFGASFEQYRRSVRRWL
jgi:protein-S-isoprenylcysteine O-methyltransferase Ste14